MALRFFRRLQGKADGPKSKKNTAVIQKPYHQRDPLTWTKDDVCLWLSAIGFSSYAPIFADNEVTGEELLELEAEDMEQLGIEKWGHRKKLNTKLRALRGMWPTAVSAASPSVSSAPNNDNSINSNHNNSSTRDSDDLSNLPDRDELVLKCVFGPDNIRFVSVSLSAPFSELISRVESEAMEELNVEDSRYIKIKFKDLEGDFVTLRNESDYRAAMACCSSSSVLKVWISVAERPLSSEVRPIDSLLSTTGILDGLADGAVMMDTSCRIRYINSAAEKIFQRSRDDLIGKNVSILMPESLAVKHDGFVQNYLKTGHKKIIGTSRKVTGQRRDGSKVSLWLTVSEHRQGEEHGFIGTLHEANPTRSAADDDDNDDDDIEDKNWVDNEMPSVRAYNVMENLTEAALVTDQRGRIVFLNRSALSLLESQKQDLLGRNVKSIIPPAYIGQDANVKEYITTGGRGLVGTQWNVALQTKVGSLVPVTISLSRDKQGKGKELFVGIIRERKDSDSMSSKSELQQEREVINNLALPGVIIDEKRSIQGFNEAACKTLGYTLMDVLGQNVKVIVPPGVHRDNHDLYVQQYLETGHGKIIGTSGREIEALAKDGTHVPLLLSVTERKINEEKRIFTAILHPRRG